MTRAQQTIIPQLKAPVALPPRTKFALHGETAVAVVNGSAMTKLHTVQITYNAGSDLYDVIEETSVMPKLGRDGWIPGSNERREISGLYVESLGNFWTKGRRQAA